MAACPQCSNDLPAGARKCPCCGKSFLSSWSGVNEAGIRRALNTAKAARRARQESAAIGLDWREAAGGIIVGFFVLYFVFGNLQVIRSGEEEVRQARASAESAAEGLLRRQIRLADSYLVPVLDGVEVRGQITNGSPRLLLQAEVLTAFTDPEGREAGEAKGEIKLLRPGQSAPFSCFGKLRSSSSKREGWTWKTELGKTAWSP